MTATTRRPDGADLADIAAYMREQEAAGNLNLEGMTHEYARAAHAEKNGAGWEDLTDGEAEYVYQLVREYEHHDRMEQARRVLNGQLDDGLEAHIKWWAEELVRRIDAWIAVRDTVRATAEKALFHNR